MFLEVMAAAQADEMEKLSGARLNALLRKLTRMRQNVRYFFKGAPPTGAQRLAGKRLVRPTRLGMLQQPARRPKQSFPLFG